MLLFPGLPDIRAIAHGGLFSIADNGGADGLGVVQQVLQLLTIVGVIAQGFGIRMLGVNEVVHAAHRPGHILQLPRAHAEPGKVHKLELHPALLKIALGLLGVKAFVFAVDLNVHKSSFLLG